jgi:hypothetical protein
VTRDLGAFGHFIAITVFYYAAYVSSKVLLCKVQCPVSHI